MPSSGAFRTMQALNYAINARAALCFPKGSSLSFRNKSMPLSKAQILLMPQFYPALRKPRPPIKGGAGLNTTFAKRSYSTIRGTHLALGDIRRPSAGLKRMAGPRKPAGGSFILFLTFWSFCVKTKGLGPRPAMRATQLDKSPKLDCHSA